MNSLNFFYKAIEEYQKRKNLDYAKKIQKHYSDCIKKNYLKWNNISPPQPLIVGGIDISFAKNSNLAITGIVILKDNTEVLEKKYIIQEVSFPYIPGFLAFRELDPVIKLFNSIYTKPNLLFFDGQGIAHPRFFGLASYGGILLQIPSIGIAKKKLIGNFKEPDTQRGSIKPLFYNNLQVGWAIRTKSNCKFIFASPGWNIGLNVIPDIVLNFSKFRIPEPTRLAHIYVNSIRKQMDL